MPSQSRRYFDWHELLDDAQPRDAVNTRQRLRKLWLVFAVLLAIVFARAVQLEISGGAQLRAEAARPRQRQVNLPATRGRILAKDGTVLAENRPALALAIDYRYLEQPLDPTWLRAQAKSRLPRGERRNAARVGAEEELLRSELSAAQTRLAELCGMSSGVWETRRRQIQSRVGALAERVNLRRRERFEQLQSEPDRESNGVTEFLATVFTPDEELPPARVVIAEQLEAHVVVDELTPEVAAEIADHAREFPGARVVRHTKRSYPRGDLAAQLVGHIALEDDASAAPDKAQSSRRKLMSGRMGLELAENTTLAGSPGRQLLTVDRRGATLSTEDQQPAIDGGDVQLGLDLELQRAGEAFLDRAMQRNGDHEHAPPASGAIVLLNVRDGQLAVAASAPRFDPNLFANPQSEQLTTLLSDPRRPLLDRVTKMAIAPGSVFKTVAAMAILESAAARADEVFHCQGFLRSPDRLRCAVFQHQGIGHGDVTLFDALARSCNVYFFHHAEALGPQPLVTWGRRCGFGRTTGVDLPDEVDGRLPTPSSLSEVEDRQWQVGDSQMLAIGQGSLTVTPLQVARLMAAIGNGGRLVTPRLVAPTAGESADSGASIEGLSPATLATLRESLRRVVEDPDGTAYESVRLASIPIAGKTGTAQTGADRADHAWFAGYLPADDPQWAVVVTLEHGGNASATGPIVRSLVQRMQRAGYFGPARSATRPAIPPGKG